MTRCSFPESFLLGFAALCQHVLLFGLLLWCAIEDCAMVIITAVLFNL